MQAVLYKRNRRGFFSKATVARACAITGQMLLYWKHRQDHAKTIPLAGAHILTGAQRGAYFYIVIRLPGGGTRQVATKSAAEQAYWVQCLNAAAIIINP